VSGIFAWVVGCLAALWVAATVFMFLFQRSFLYARALDPLSSPAEAGLPEMAVVSLTTGDGLILTAWYRPAPEGAPTVVLFHGNAGTLSHRVDKARFMIDAGLGLLLVEWRGYGGNPGRPSEEGLLADGRAALDFLEARGVPADRRVHYGESLGGGLAIPLATLDPKPMAVVTEGTFTSAVDMGRRRYPILPVSLLMLDRFDTKAIIGNLSVPLLVLHGQKDTIVPMGMGRILAEATAGPVETFFPAEGGHVDLFSHGAGPVMVAFLRRHGWSDGV
jgi:fermentation-respiration switch protein FrsA (DUF1100 family)